MDKLLIRGGHQLHGEVPVSGAKNAALPELCAAIAIRTMVLTPAPATHDDSAAEPAEAFDRRWTASVQAGAGIVADSDPADEYLETQNKAKALLVAIPAAEEMSRQRRDAFAKGDNR